MEAQNPSDGAMNSSVAKSAVAGIVRVNLSADQTRLIGNCPTCGTRLSVELRQDGSFGTLVACMRCKAIYRVESKDVLTQPPDRPCGLAVSYTIEGRWEPTSIMEYLFDNVGTVTTMTGGFVCHPDDEHLDFPTITVDEETRTVRFGLFGEYAEREAGGIIAQVVSEFATKFDLDLGPVRFERWEFQDPARGFILVEERPLGTLLRERSRRQARA